MELIAKLVNTQLGNFFPVVVVIILATLVYTFGFKSPEQPQFDKLSSLDDRKSTGKKRKIKDKKTANGFAVSLSESKSEKPSTKDKELKRSPTKDTPETPKKVKKQESNTKPVEAKKAEAKPKKVENLEDIKNKKNKAKFEKPVDFDEGDWETVPNKNDKKKKLDSPIKKEKKGKAQVIDNKDKEIQKLVKGEIEKHLQQDSNKENKSNEGNKKIASKGEVLKEVKEIIPVIEETKPKKEKKPKKQKVVEEVITLPPVVENSKVEQEKVSAKIQDVKEVAATEVKQPSGEAVFDELGDVWTEAKAVKKSKKKSRRD